MKTFSFFKLICMLVCSFALFASCAGGSSVSNGGSSAGDSTGANGGSTSGTGGGSGSGSGSGGSSEDPNDYGIIKDYNPVISAEKRHIIANEVLTCSTGSYSPPKYFITESGEVYSNYNYYRLNILDKSGIKVTDNVKIVSGECIKGSEKAILKSKEGKYYITNIKYNTSTELTFYKDKATPYAEGEEVKFGNVEYVGSESGVEYYAALKEGVIHFWSSLAFSPINVSGSNSFTQMYTTFTKMYTNGLNLFVITSAGTLYKLNIETLQMEEFTEIYYKTGRAYNLTDESNFTKVSEAIKFKAIYSDGTFISNDNRIYQYKYWNGKARLYRIAARNKYSLNDDFKLEKVFEKETLYYKYPTINKSSYPIGKDTSGNYYNLRNDYNFVFVDQLSNEIIEPTSEIYNYYYSSPDWLVFYKTSEGLDVIGANSYGTLGIGRDDRGIISTTNGERKKVEFPASDGNINVERVLHVNNYNIFNIFAFTDKGIYTWGKNSTGEDNKAVPEKVKAYRITAYPTGMGTVSGTYDCDLTLTKTEVTDINIKDTLGDLFITENGRVFRLYRGDLIFYKSGWRYYYECSKDNVISNSFVQLDLGEGVIAKGLLDEQRVLTNIGILNVWRNSYFNWQEDIVGTIKD